MEGHICENNAFISEYRQKINAFNDKLINQLDAAIADKLVSGRDLYKFYIHIYELLNCDHIRFLNESRNLILDRYEIVRTLIKNNDQKRASEFVDAEFTQFYAE